MSVYPLAVTRSQRIAALQLEVRKRKLRFEQAKRSLIPFTKYVFPGYEVNWHHQVLAEALERLAAGEIKRLMVFMPPRMGKSELVSRKFPAFVLGKNPNTQIIASSYSQDLIRTMARAVKRTVQSEDFQRLFPGVHLSSGSKEASGYVNTTDEFEMVGSRGYYKAAGIGAGITGRGFTLGIIDDILKDRQQANSQIIRDGIWDWYTSTFYTRAEKNASILLTQTRWHEDDLAGRLLDAARDGTGDHWHVISFSGLYEPSLIEDLRENPGITLIGTDVDKREEGDPLWPNKYSKKVMEQYRSVLGSLEFSAQYQQSPKSLGGNIFQSEWFRYYTVHHHEVVVQGEPAGTMIRDLMRFATIDVAGTTKTESDYSVIAVWGCDAKKRLFLLELYRGKHDAPGLLTLMEDVQRQHAVHCMYIEQNGLGLPIFQFGQAAKLRLIGVEQHKDKVARAMAAAPWVQRGEVFFRKDAPWRASLESELTVFPNGTHDDQVDVVSLAAQIMDSILFGGVAPTSGAVVERPRNDDTLGTYGSESVTAKAPTPDLQRRRSEAERNREAKERREGKGGQPRW